MLNFPGSKQIPHENLLELDVEVLYPAALENAIHRKNADNIKAKIVCELANGPTTPEADLILIQKGSTCNSRYSCKCRRSNCFLF